MTNTPNASHPWQDTATQVEEAVICSLLLTTEAILSVYPVLKPEMFSNPRLMFIYTAIRALYERGERADLVTTNAELRRIDEARYVEMNGLSYLSEAMCRIRHTASLAQYVEEVKRLHMLRSLESLFLTMKMKASGFASGYMEIITETEQALLELREKYSVGKPVQQIGSLAREVLELHRNRYENKTDDMRVLTGIDEFDYVTGGLHNGELSIEGGRPSDGKTAVAIQIAINAAQAGKHVCFFSLEMTGLQTMNRIFAGHAGVDANRLRIEGLTSCDLTRMEQLTGNLHKLPLYFDYSSGNSVQNLRAQAILQHRKGQCDLVVVDYLHLLEVRPQRGETLEQLIARNIRALKQLAIEINCPVLVLSQMNRASEQRSDKAHIPELHDLRDSGTIEQVADCVFFVYRPERHGIIKDEVTGESLIRVGKLYIQKNRNGSIGVARYRYNESYTRITNYTNRLPL